MPRGRKQTRPFVETIRRKCEDTGTVKHVNYKYYLMPMSNKAYISNHEKRPKRTEVKDVVVKYYHTLEGAEAAHGKGSFTNIYDDEQFVR